MTLEGLRNHECYSLISAIQHAALQMDLAQQRKRDADTDGGFSDSVIRSGYGLVDVLVDTGDRHNSRFDPTEAKSVWENAD